MERGLCGRARTLIQVGGHFIMACLVRTEPFDEENVVDGLGRYAID